MDNELERRLTRIDLGIAQLRDHVDRQISGVRAAIAEMRSEVTRSLQALGEPGGEPLGPLLRQLIHHIERSSGVANDTMAAVRDLVAQIEILTERQD